MSFRKMRIPIIETERLTLRMWERKDAKALFEYASDPEVGPRAGWKPHKTVHESKVMIENYYMGTMSWAITLKGENKPIGCVGLSPDRYRTEVVNSREIGYSLGRPYWGQGIITEAIMAIVDYSFVTLNLDMISARVGLDNGGSQRVLEKTGFVYEGLLRKAYRMYDGSVKDICCYSVTPRDLLGQ
jgi:RimJ/RimL family protein N-acetyltransferase